MKFDMIPRNTRDNMKLTLFVSCLGIGVGACEVSSRTHSIIPPPPPPTSQTISCSFSSAFFTNNPHDGSQAQCDTYCTSLVTTCDGIETLQFDATLSAGNASSTSCIFNSSNPADSQIAFAATNVNVNTSPTAISLNLYVCHNNTFPNGIPTATFTCNPSPTSFSVTPIPGNMALVGVTCTN